MTKPTAGDWAQCRRARPGGIKVRMKRYKYARKGFAFSVLVKKNGRWRTIGHYETEDEACLEIARQLNLLDSLIDLS